MKENITKTTLTIGDVARRSGVPESTLRYYESIGLLPAPERLNGRRRYAAKDTFQWLQIIQVAQQAGFTLGEIRELFTGFPVETTPSVRWGILAQRKLEELAAQLERIRLMQQLLQEGLRCQCLTFEQCASQLCGTTPAQV